MTSKRALVLVNASSRSGNGDVRCWAERIADLGVDVRLERPSSPHETRLRIVESARDGGIDRVVLAGGDGTVHQALPALLEVRLPVALIPLGTANDLAETLGLPSDPLKACEVAATGRPTRIDVGLANGVPFVNVANMGLGVQVTRSLDAEAKRRWGALSYLRTAADALRDTRPFHAEVRGDSGCTIFRSMHLAVGNGVRHGGGIRVAEDASIADGCLDLYSLPPSGAARLALLLPWMRTGLHSRLEQVHTLRSRTLRVRTLPRLDVYADGERVTETPVAFQVLPGALEALTPAGSGAERA